MATMPNLPAGWRWVLCPVCDDPVWVVRNVIRMHERFRLGEAGGWFRCAGSERVTIEKKPQTISS